MSALHTGQPLVLPPAWSPIVGRGVLDRLDANTGGHSSRTRSERLRASVLGRDQGHIRCPRVLHVGLLFDSAGPFTWISRWLKHCAFADEDEARLALALPPEPCICRPSTVQPTKASTLSPLDGLTQVLILGLSTPWCYDPSRPVLWTSASLTRRLDLFDGRGFYA